MRYAVVVAGLLVALCASAPAWGQAGAAQARADLVLDQFRPDLVDTFDMRTSRR